MGTTASASEYLRRVRVVEDLGSDRYDLPPGAANLRHEASFALQRVARVA
jgi:hypothetical protein